MDRFERKDPEIHFRELAQLRQNRYTRGIYHRVLEVGCQGN
jgi:hypothetical protein